MAYSLLIQERNGEAVAALTNATNRRFSFYLNRASEFSCNVSMVASEATRANLTPGTKELVAYRDGEALETVFALNRVSVNADQNEQRLDLSFSGIVEYLADALIYGTASAWSGTALPWSWINTFQSRTGGSYGITQGATVGTAPTRTRIIEQDAGLLDEIINLSETGTGFDFAINTARQWVEYHATRGNDNGVVLQYGMNVRNFAWEESTTPGELVTDVRVYGQGTSGAPRTASDSTARTTYGRREASLTYTSEAENAVTSAAQLQQFADAALDRTTPLVIPQVELVPNHAMTPFGSYWLGDTITFQARIGAFVNIDAQYRIVGVHIELDAEDNETIKLDLNVV